MYESECGRPTRPLPCDCIPAELSGFDEPFQLCAFRTQVISVSARLVHFLRGEHAPATTSHCHVPEQVNANKALLPHELHVNGLLVGQVLVVDPGTPKAEYVFSACVFWDLIPLGTCSIYYFITWTLLRFLPMTEACCSFSAVLNYA